MPLLEEIQKNQFGDQGQIQQPSYGQSPNALREGMKKMSSILSGISSIPKMATQGIQQYEKNPPQVYNGIKNVISSMGTITTPFGGQTKFEGFHPGLDIANKIGTSIKSFAPGVVKEVVTGLKKGDKGYGNYIIVEDPYGNKHRYSHLAQSFVRVGDPVTAGKNIGAMGATGSTYSLSGGTGSHLDYRIRDAAGRYLDPFSYLQKFYKQKYG